MITFGLCRLHGFPLFLSSRFLPVLSALRVSRVLPLFICFSPFLLDMDLSRALIFARIISYWRFYLCFVFFLPLRLSFIVLFGGYFLSLVLLWLGLVSAKSHPHVQLIRAELSSKSSSEPPSESLSKLELSSNPSLS